MSLRSLFSGLSIFCFVSGASATPLLGNFLATGEFEVMLSKGLGQHFVYDEKARLFQDAKNIADLLSEVMDRRTKERERSSA